MAPNSPLPLLQSLSYSMGNPATSSSSLCPVTPVTSPHKATDPKDAIMGVVYATLEVLREAKPLDPSMDLEFLIREFLSALHELHSFSDSVSQMHYARFHQKAQVHLDAFVQPSWLSWCRELISPEWAAAVSAGKELSPPPVTEASMHTPSDTGEVAASGSPTASTDFDDLLPLAVSTSASVVAAPVAAVTAEGVPVPKFEFQARAANPVAIDPPSDSDTAAMEVDIPLATMVAKPPFALGSGTIELSSNDEDNSDSDEVQYVGGNIPNLSPAHPKKGKGCGRKPAKPSGTTAAFEDQYVRMPVQTFCDCSLPPTYLLLWQRPFITCLCLYCLSSEKVSHANDSDGWLSLKKIYRRNGWAVPKSPEASVMVKASRHQVRYDRKMRDANTAGSEKVTELELPLNTPIDEYEVALAAVPRLLPISSLPDMPETESEVDDASDEVVVKQEKEAAGPSHRNLAIPPPLSGAVHPRRLSSFLLTHFHASTIVVPLTKVLKPHSSKSKSHIKGSSKTTTVKLEPSRASATVIEPSAASTQLKQMIELSQQLLTENRILRAHRS
ncbi:uncharacterized protein LAESUDRAFT_755775 [Laetiporus sulphureus 93-53]|uniref:Uncharacterized protein n=1 Tax=Laetiporus sulphureus 93-53 TaxID=1314785 RepID=A0A165GFB1_9APHY|nr:uncharacterized protein LAESUDRAFT_755775 [Laetiporus sulphureus 93-53]KZT10269.1 hypothetical protein LAESUDRAFT_755775 [Laetiporus sulphureus 93-53]